MKHRVLIVLALIAGRPVTDAGAAEEWKVIRESPAAGSVICRMLSPTQPNGARFALVNAPYSGSFTRRGAARIDLFLPSRLGEVGQKVDLAVTVPGQVDWGILSFNINASSDSGSLASAFVEDKIDRAIPPLSRGFKFVLNGLPAGQFEFDLLGSYAGLVIFEECLGDIGTAFRGHVDVTDLGPPSSMRPSAYRTEPSKQLEQNTASEGTEAPRIDGSQIWSLNATGNVIAQEGISLENIESEGYTVVRSTLASPPSEGRTGGAFVEIPAALAARLGGKEIEVEIVARSSRENGAPYLFAAYSTASVGNSGWRKLELGRDFSRLRFVYSVPLGGSGAVSHFLGLVPGLNGEGLGADLRSVAVRLR